MTLDLDRRALLHGLAMTGAAALAQPATGKPGMTNRPNMIFIMADDLGYADVSCYGRREYRTPAIDRIAAEGLKFTQAYSNSAVCSATRTALMTGRYQNRLPIGLEEPLVARDLGLPPEHPTLPSLLRDAGYTTALIGKWHLGRLPHYGPLKSGYDQFWGMRGGAVDYFTHANAMGPDLWDDDTRTSAEGYLTDLLGDKAVAYVEDKAKGDKPFFLSLHFNAPHWPWEGPDDQAESARIAAKKDPFAIFHFDGGTQAVYAEMVVRMDQQIGRVLDALERAGIADNTIIVFTSDNGGERFSDNWPFTGMKTELLEGGLRVPLVVRWPGRIAPGSVSDQVTITMDWVGTLLNAGGGKPDIAHPLDGIDLAPAFAGAAPTERTLCWRFKHLDQKACRSGNLKYLEIGGNSFLFDVVADPLERANLKDLQPDDFARLKAIYGEWERRMLPLDAESFTHGYSGVELADHFGVPHHVPAGLPPRPQGH